MTNVCQPSSSLLSTASPPQIALASFANMFSVGTVYALSTLQAELPRLLEVSHHSSFAPFGSACLGLSSGAGICAPLIAKYGARTMAAQGTAFWGLAVISTGYFLARSNFQAILGCLFIGGIGVGWTYLAVIIMIGRGLPSQPLTRSAIGPLGFSSGTAACVALSSYYEFSSLSAEKLGQVLNFGGTIFIIIGAVTMVLLPNDAGEHEHSSLPPKALASSTDRFFSTLLFFNALPGMVTFSALLPVVSYYKGGHVHTGDPLKFLPFGIVTLALGGLLAPTLSSLLGARSTFVVLFCLRGMMLIVFSQYPEPEMATITLLTVLFAHGTGFSILPGLIKAQQVNNREFSYSYGRVLITWGTAGVVGSLINASLIPLSGEATMASLVIGLLVLAFGACLYFASSFGRADL